MIYNGMIRFYLMNYKSNIVHYINGKLYEQKINNISYKDAVKIYVDPSFRDINAEDLYIFSREYHEFECVIRDFTKCKLIYNPRTRAFSFRSYKGKYLCFDGTNLDFTRDEALMWESFLLVDEQFIEKIKYVVNNKWISKRNKKIISGKEIIFESDFVMKIDEFSLDIRSQKTIDFGKYNLTGFCDAWKLEEFLLYNPLIYITAYSSKTVLEQLKVCVRSLREFAGFTGRIIVMSDQDATWIREFCNEQNAASLDVDPMKPKDFVGYVCSKFSLLDKKYYDGYQPIMYLDPDIVFSCDIEQMLLEATLSEDICAPLEDFHRLQTHIPVGGGLIQLDSLNPSPYAAGYNGGTIIYPNIENAKVKNFIEVARRTIKNIGESFGRSFNQWADQEVINYISAKKFNLNTSVLTKYARYVDHDPKSHVELTGFVHFWGAPSAEEKVVRMTKYFNKVRNIMRCNVI